MSRPLLLAAVALLSGCIDSARPFTPLEISIDAPRTPPADVALAGDTIRFAALGFLSGTGDPTWDFGDGHEARGRSVTHAYATPGSYTVTVRVGGTTDAGQVNIAGHSRFDGSLPPPPPRGEAEAARHRLDVLEEAHLVHLFFHAPREHTLQYRWLSPDGDEVASGSLPPPAERTILRPLGPGAHTLELRAQTSLPRLDPIPYDVEVVIRYGLPPRSEDI